MMILQRYMQMHTEVELSALGMGKLLCPFRITVIGTRLLAISNCCCVAAMKRSCWLSSIFEPII
jgi:hypothetical protein